MFMKSSQIKALAREYMTQNNKLLNKTTIILILLTSGISTLLFMVVGNPILQAQQLLATGQIDAASKILTSSAAGISVFIVILLSLFSYIINFGYRTILIRTIQQRSPQMGELFDGFSYVGRIIMTELGILVRVFGWSVLVGVAFTMIMMFGMFVFSASNLLTTIFMVIAVISLYVVILVITVRYTLCGYVLSDRPDEPEIGFIRTGIMMIKGHEKRLIFLMLSFFGWLLLIGLGSFAVTEILAKIMPNSVIVVTIIEFFVMLLPTMLVTLYQNMSYAVFYAELNGDLENSNQNEPRAQFNEFNSF